jgi:class 3 adenylate cyclase
VIEQPSPAIRYARSADVHVAYQVLGSGPPLVLAADWFGHLDTRWEWPPYARALRKLASFSELIVFDKRGTGLSDPVDTGRLPSLEDWMDDVRAVLDDAGIGRSDLIGVGAGAVLVLLFAAIHPHRVERIVLVNAFARLRRDHDHPAGFPPELAERILARSYTEPTDADVIGGSDRNAPFRAWWARYQRHSVSPGAALAMRRMMFDLDIRSVLPSVQAPTLVLHRRDDAWIRVDHGRHLAEHISGATLVELDGDEDLFFQGDADELLGHVEQFLHGVRQPVEVDRVLATVLFTDLVDSTPLAVRLGDRRWTRLLDDHDAIIDRAVAAHRGERVKHTGDGVLAVFDGAARAVRCAAAIRDGLDEIGLAMRAGLHAGEIERRGDDIGGIAVHVAARVMGLAGAGEIVVSRLVHDLVAGSGIDFVELGPHDLRGVPGELTVFRAQA